MSTHTEWLASWALGHNDAYHPGGREGCEHCQAMIAAFGPMPSIEEIQAYNAGQRRERETGFKAPIPRHIRWEVWERDNFTCKQCGTRRNLSVDHIVAESQGGTLDPDNLQTLCSSCNSRKGAR